MAILSTPAPAEKIRLTTEAVAAWQAGTLETGAFPQPPDRPARAETPRLLRPGEMPRRRTGGVRGRIALLHALAHIELNAIDLAWDIIARFGAGRPRDFIEDWIRVAAEEAKHHALLEARLGELGARYGDLPAHDGLWESAMTTAHDLQARLAIVPLVLEARGLDVTPEMAAALIRGGDSASAAIVQIILADEITHVAIGRHWFEILCAERGDEPVAAWQRLVRALFKGRIKPPFNQAARDAAGFGALYYAPLADAA